MQIGQKLCGQTSTARSQEKTRLIFFSLLLSLTFTLSLSLSHTHTLFTFVFCTYTSKRPPSNQQAHNFWSSSRVSRRDTQRRADTKMTSRLHHQRHNGISPDPKQAPQFYRRKNKTNLHTRKEWKNERKKKKLTGFFKETKTTKGCEERTA